MQKIASYKPQAAKHPASAIDSKSSKLLTALMRTHTLMDRCCYREQAPETTNGVNESKHLGGPLLLRIFQPAGKQPSMLLGGRIGGRRDGDPTMTGSVDLRSWDNGYAKSHRRRCGSGGAAAMARRAACSGIENKRLHTQPSMALIAL